MIREIECETCEGTGTLERMNCRNGSNDCCGGCYIEVTCEDCLGYGFTELEDYEEED